MTRDEKKAICARYQAPIDALRKALGDLERQMQAEIDAIERSERAVAALGGFPAIGDLALRMVDAGTDRNSAAVQIWRDTGTQPETVTHYLDRAIKARDRQRRAARDREIMRLMRAGRTNAEISSAAGVSTRTVSRIIRDSAAAPQF